MSTADSISTAKTRLLHILKTKGPQSAAALARRLSVTPMAIRQHLAGLESAGLVEHEDERGQVGRPRRIWRLRDTDEVHRRFPDSHAELTVDLLEAARTAFGAEGLAKLIEERTHLQEVAYRRRIPEEAPVEKKLAELARIRQEEGYLAEWRREPSGGFLFVENHCPICAAAKTCVQLCRNELALFRFVLGPEVAVERTEYILEGARRCAYRITHRAGSGPKAPRVG